MTTTRWIAVCGAAVALLTCNALLAGCGSAVRVSAEVTARPGSAAGVESPSPSSSTVVGLARPVDIARARTALASFVRAFYVRTGTGAYWNLDTAGGGPVTFYRQAEMLEVVEDAYARSRLPAYRQMIVALMNGVTTAYGTDWSIRYYNDDILWMVIASLRASELTGRPEYLAWAKRNFDAVWARGWTSSFGGGLWWKASSTEKNVTTNAPAAIVACLLARRLHDPAYLAKAELLYAWVRDHLYDTRTGEVWDALSGGLSGPAVRRVGLTYNQGTFIGAADLLYQATGQPSYYTDALRTLRFTKAHLVEPGGILQAELGGPDSNPGGFKGIFCRWATRFTRDNHLTEFDAWFRANAAAVWKHRDSRGLMGTEWSQPTSSGLLYAWDCSSAVALLQAVATH